jgi:hypothetical protein
MRYLAWIAIGLVVAELVALLVLRIRVFDRFGLVSGPVVDLSLRGMLWEKIRGLWTPPATDSLSGITDTLVRVEIGV